MNALAEFERREPEISGDIVTTLKALGDSAVLAYAAVGLYHNTLSSFVPSIQRDGLVADSPEAVPEQADVDFAAELFEAKGYRYPASQRQFDILIRGSRQDREPGVFFYPLANDATEYRTDYAVPERVHLLAMEMGYVMLQESGLYSADEQQKARAIFEKYRDLINGHTDAHVAVLKVNPFSPDIINHRLENLKCVSQHNNLEDVIRQLKVLGHSEYDGIYIPGSVPPDDLTLMDAKLPIIYSLDETKLRPTESRFFYTPPHLRRQY